MRYLKWLVAASIAALCVNPAIASPSQEDQDFCMVTAKVTYNVIEARAKLPVMPALAAVEAEVSEIAKELEFTPRELSATIRAIRFGYGAPAGADAEAYAKYQYMGCLSTEI